MRTTISRRSGGYFSLPNRWVDAGYMAACPGSVTQVYVFLSRWADNTTLEAAQPMRLIAMKCGLTEDVARKAVRILETWGVLTRLPGTGRSAANVWILEDLPEKAPEYPDKKGPKQSRGPRQTAPPQNRAPYQPEEIKETDKSVSVPVDSATEKTMGSQPETETDTNGHESTGTKSRRKKPLEPDEVLVQVWADECNDGTWPVNVGLARNHAKRLIAAGFDSDELRDMIAWARTQSWRSTGITVQFLASQADAYRTAKREGKTVRRQANASGGHAYG